MPLLHAARFDCAAHDREGTTESITRSVWAVATPLHYIWAAFSPKTGGRYRPNRDFRSRSFFRVKSRSWFLDEVLRRAVGERNAYL